MFAVIKTGGKQYKVAAGDTLAVERLAAEAGDTVLFEDVLMIGGDSPTMGTPTISDAGVKAEVVEQGKGPKTLNLKRRRRKHSSRRLKGHRQFLTTVRIVDILASGAGSAGVKAAVGAAVAGVAPALGSTATPEPAKTVTEGEGEAPAPAPAEEPAVEAAAEVEAPAEPAAKGSDDTVQTARPGNLLEEAQGEPDDLSKISGVGPKLLQKLNENGVFHFWQIAEWGPDEVAFMDDQLSFKGRIDRDDWIVQATEMAKGTE